MCIEGCIFDLVEERGRGGNESATYFKEEREEGKNAGDRGKEEGTALLQPGETCLCKIKKSI